MYLPWFLLAGGIGYALLPSNVKTTIQKEGRKAVRDMSREALERMAAEDKKPRKRSKKKLRG